MVLGVSVNQNACNFPLVLFFSLDHHDLNKILEWGGL